MSAASDKYERDVAAYINSIPGIKANRPSVGTGYSDILMEYANKKEWLEVKMSHTDNLSNPRIFYDGSKWGTTYKTPVAIETAKIMNSSKEAKVFIQEIEKFTGIKNPKIPSTKAGLKEKGAVPLNIMKMYFSQPNINRYITTVKNVDLGKMVTAHYTEGKTAPAYYMQAGDDFYLISNVNPFGLHKQIPLLSGEGDFKVRISTRSEFYEVQAEIKIMQMPVSKYSLKPGTTKKIHSFYDLFHTIHHRRIRVRTKKFAR